MSKYRAKPIIKEAVKWTGCNYKYLTSFIGDCSYGYNGSVLSIETLGGLTRVNVGDYVVKGLKGEFYPCKPDIFEMTYEKVEETNPTKDEK